MADEKSKRAHFFIKFVEDKPATELVGRPVVKAQEMISIAVDQTYRMTAEATDHYIRKYPELYREFKAALPEDLEGGVELRNVPGISLKREEELRRQGVLFVEQLLTGTEAEAVKKWGPDADKLRLAAITYMRGDSHPVVTGERPPQTEDLRTELRRELERHGVKPDGRWGVKRLREELAKAEAPADVERLAAAL